MARFVGTTQSILTRLLGGSGGGVVFPVGSAATTYMGADRALNNVSTFFDGPTTGSLPPGTYLLLATALVTDSAAGVNIVAQISDGTVALASSRGSIAAANQFVTIGLQVVVTTTAPATTFTLQAKDVSATSGVLLRSAAAATTANVATNITAIRLP